MKGPALLTNRSLWPEQPEITETKEASCETLPAKKEKVLLEKKGGGGATNERKEWVETILRKHKYSKLLRVTAYMMRFVKNRRQKEQRKGPLTTDEIAAAGNRWLKIAQEDEEVNRHFALKCLYHFNGSLRI